MQERALGAVIAALGERGPVTVHLTSDQQDVDAALRDLDGRRPVVVGGDGSLHLIVNRLLALGLEEVPLGLVPLGTGNDLARGLGLPLEPAEAAAIARDGQTRPLPVLVRNDGHEVVLNNAHVGLGERAAQVAVGLKPRLKALAYPVGALVAGVRPRAQDMRVSVDGEVVAEGPIHAVVVALGPSAGGGHRVIPDADLTVPALDVFVLSPCGLTGRLALAAAVAAGRDPRHRPGVGRWRGREVSIEHPAVAELDWDVDGESRRWPTPVRLHVRPAAWSLLSGSAGQTSEVACPTRDRS